MREGGGGRTGGRGIGRGVSARAREGRRPTPIVSRGFRATRACYRVPRGGRTISATALDARRRERAGRTARREARRGARRPNAVRRAAETCAVERASDMESGAGGQKPSRPTAVARAGPRTPKKRDARRAPPHAARFIFLARASVVPDYASSGDPIRSGRISHAARGARARLRGLAPARAPTPVSARPSSCAAATPRAATTTATATRAAAAGTRGARGGCAGSSRRSRTSARATAPTARTTAPRANPARATPARARGCDEVRDEDATRSSPFAATEARLRAPRERIRAESTHHASSASPLIHLGPAPNAIVSLPPPLSRSQSSASEPTAPDAPRIIPPHRRPRRAPRRALRDSRLNAAATPRP